MKRYVIYDHFNQIYVGKNTYKGGLLQATKFHSEDQAQKHAFELSKRHEKVALEVKAIYFGEYYE